MRVREREGEGEGEGEGDTKHSCSSTLHGHMEEFKGGIVVSLDLLEHLLDSDCSSDCSESVGVVWHS